MAVELAGMQQGRFSSLFLAQRLGLVRCWHVADMRPGAQCRQLRAPGWTYVSRLPDDSF